MSQKVEIILASGSPRRRELLAREGVQFSVQVANVDETLEPDLLRQPEEAVKKLAERKAGAVVQQVLGDPEYVGAAAIIGADTVVVSGGKIYGKPANEEDACRMLGELSGRTHQVITGVSVWMLSAPPNKDVSLGFRTFTETSRVTFKQLDEGDIAEYVAGGEPMDKAGAYAIQGGGRAFVEHVEGDFDNIVGLPVGRLLSEFSEIFEAAK